MVITAEGKLVQSLPSNPSEMDHVRLLKPSATQDDEIEKATPDIEMPQEDVAVSNEAKDLTRKSGDMDVYKYYFRSVGFNNMMKFLFSCILHVFCACFMGKLIQISR